VTEPSPDKELMIGEVTPEVKAFLESMGRKVYTPEEEVAVWQATHTVGRPKRVSRHVVHDPGCWTPLMSDRWPQIISASRVEDLRSEVLEEFEVGTRVSTAFRLQHDILLWLSSVSPPIRLNQTESESEAA
jgi:hypothetical protein